MLLVVYVSGLPEPRSGGAGTGGRESSVARCSATPTRWLAADRLTRCDGSRPPNGQLGWAMSDGEQELVERFGRGLVAERLARPAVQRAGNGLDLLGVAPGEVGALGEVLAQQPVGVLVAGALPGAVRVGEVDRDPGLDLQLRVLSELAAAVPGQRTAQLFGHRGHLRRDRGAHRLGSVAAQGRPILDRRPEPPALDAGQMQQHGEPGAALDQGPDGRAAGADDQIALPVSG